MAKGDEMTYWFFIILFLGCGIAMAVLTVTSIIYPQSCF